jgi:hypothetical protein
VESPLDWTHRTAEIDEDGRAETRTATVAELQALAGALEILSCVALSARYEIKPAGRGRFQLMGEFEADVTQACVVTLDPVPQHIAEQFSVAFWPEEDVRPASGSGEHEVLQGDDPEALKNGCVEAGRIVFEHLSAALDPYPRKPGAEFEWQDPKAEAVGEGAGPFAILERLKSGK